MNTTKPSDQELEHFISTWDTVPDPTQHPKQFLYHWKLFKYDSTTNLATKTPDQPSGSGEPGPVADSTNAGSDCGNQAA
jgi:hypothetical protein